MPAAFHNTAQYANNGIECDHGRLKARLRPMRGLKRDHTARVIIGGTRSYKISVAATTNSEWPRATAGGSKPRSPNSPEQSDRTPETECRPAPHYNSTQQRPWSPCRDRFGVYDADTVGERGPSVAWRNSSLQIRSGDTPAARRASVTASWYVCGPQTKKRASGWSATSRSTSSVCNRPPSEVTRHSTERSARRLAIPLSSSA